MANAISVRMNWTVANLRQQSQVLHFANPAPIAVNQALADNVADACEAALSSSGLRAGLKTTVELTDVAVRDVSVPTSPEYISAVGMAGTGTTDLLPIQTAMCVTLRTNKAGRSFRGRTYLGGFVEGTSDVGGRIGSGTRTQGVAFIQGVADNVNAIGGGLELGVLSRTLDEINIVTQILSRDNVWDTQRRRARPLD